MKGWLRRSPGKETLVFMLGSALFFYLMRLDRDNDKRTPLFWFFTPPRVSKETGEPVTGIHGRSPACPHKEPCINYILKGTAQLFGVGCAMTMLRTLIPKILTPVKAFKSLKMSHMKLGLFFGGYIGIYRILGSWGYQKGLIPEKWPLVEILYCLCQGLLFHARVMHEDVCPRYIINLMHTVTSSKADEIQSAFIQKMLKYASG
ncbi:hypothetical protein HF086_008412 [Spodoptera exigua]|uniref:Uncharacterized protein n=1 Tax=Spodoptera exigua TaxID=7107 RepID=A0A922MHG1_SPOEX|nr:hypothetical protein HF086_008412 [Spodoptera exigua]